MWIVLNRTAVICRHIISLFASYLKMHKCFKISHMVTRCWQPQGL